MAYYASSSPSQPYYSYPHTAKGGGEGRFELDEETRGRTTQPSFSYTSSVSTSYGGGPQLVYYESHEEDEGSNESEDLIFEMDQDEPPDEHSSYITSTETPPTPTTYALTLSRQPSSYFSSRPDLEALPSPPSEPDLSSSLFEGFNRATATTHESLADMLVREVGDEFTNGGEEGSNAWATQRLRALVDLLSNETITSRARGQEEVQATMALLNFFHVNLQISTSWLLPEVRRWRESLFWSGLVESHEAAGDEW